MSVASYAALQNWPLSSFSIVSRTIFLSHSIILNYIFLNVQLLHVDDVLILQKSSFSHMGPNSTSN